MIQLIDEKGFKKACEELGLSYYAIARAMDKWDLDDGNDDLDDLIGEIISYGNGTDSRVLKSMENHYLGVLSLSYLHHLQINDIKLDTYESERFVYIGNLMDFSEKLAWTRFCKEADEKLSCCFRVTKKEHTEK